MTRITIINVQSAQKRDKQRVNKPQAPTIIQYVVHLLRQKQFIFPLNLMISALHMFGFIYVTYKKVTEGYPNYDIAVSARVVDIVNGFLGILANITVLTTVCRSSALPDLIIYFCSPYSSVKENRSSRYYSSKIRVPIWCIISILPLAISFPASLICDQWSQYQYLLCQDLEYTIFSITATFLILFSKQIQYRYAEMNNLLLQLTCEDFVPASEKSKHFDSLKYLNSLENITEQYNRLCDRLDAINKIFKQDYVINIMCICGNIIWNLTMIIMVGLPPPNMSSRVIKEYMFSTRSINIIMSTGQAALAAMVGEHIADEGQKTTVLCYSIINKQPSHLLTETDQLIEMQLNLLLDQSKTRNVSLHAGGFFKLNWGILGSIASTVATYTIVIIQFLLK